MGEVTKYKALGTLTNKACEVVLQEMVYDYLKKESVYKDYGHGYLILGEQIKILIFKNNSNEQYNKGEYHIFKSTKILQEVASVT